MERRCAGVFVTLILLFMAMVLRIFVLSRSRLLCGGSGRTEQLAAGGGPEPGTDLMTAISSR